MLCLEIAAFATQIVAPREPWQCPSGCPSQRGGTLRLYPKCTVSLHALNPVEMHHRERLNDIRVLRLKIAAGATQIGALRTALADADLLKAEVHSLGRAVLQERTKVAALTKELETPLNVHRHRDFFCTFQHCWS